MISNHKSHCAAQPPITCAVCSLTLKNLRSLREHNKTSKHERNAALAAQTVVHLPPALNELLTTVAKASTTSLHAGAAQPHPQLDDTLPLHEADNFGDFGGFDVRDDFNEGIHAHAQGTVHEGGGLALGFDRMNAHLICTFWLNTFEQKTTSHILPTSRSADRTKKNNNKFSNYEHSE
jgi:hypothetical protein